MNMKKNRFLLLFLALIIRSNSFGAITSQVSLSRLKEQLHSKVQTLRDCFKKSKRCTPDKKKSYYAGTAVITITLLIALGIYLKKRSSSQEPPLIEAIRSFDRPAITTILENPKTNINLILSNGKTPLTQAVFHRNPAIVKMLLEKGASVDLRDKDNRTAFDRAIFTPDPRADIITLLIQYGAQLNVKDRNGNTPLLAIIKEEMTKDDHEITSLLIEKGADIHTPDSQGYTPLHKAVRYNYREAAKALIAKGADVNLPDPEGNPPLVTAAGNNFADMVDILLTAPSIAINATNKDGQNALAVAGRARIIEALKAKGAIE